MNKLKLLTLIFLWQSWLCLALPLSELPHKDHVHYIGIFVGTFDPLHLGHEQTIQAVLDSGYVDAVVILPQNFQVLGMQPYKPKALPIEHRLDMLFYRWQTAENVFVPTGMKEIGENMMGGVSAWLRANMPRSVVLMGIHGTDNYTSLTKRLVERLTLGTDATLLVDKQQIPKTLDLPDQFLGRPIHILEIPLRRDIRSTELRQILSEPNVTREDISELMDLRLFELIQARGYYRARDCNSVLAPN